MALRTQTILRSAALVAAVTAIVSCTPFGAGDVEVVDVPPPAPPEMQDATVEHGAPLKPEHLHLCESPSTFIPFEKPIESQIYQVLTAYKTGLDETLERLTAKVIVAESARYGLDPWFVMGVIRVESRFYNFAHSNKNALGLMQVRPFVGEEVARDLGVEWNGANTLFNPVKNVKIGVSYLALLNQSFKGDKNKILAGYNMGPYRVRRWIKAGRELPTNYSGLVQEYAELLGNIGTHTVPGTDLVGRVTMIERNMARKQAVIATVAEIPSVEVVADVASDAASATAPATLPAEPAIEPLDVSPMAAATPAEAAATTALGEEPAMPELSSPEPAIVAEEPAPTVAPEGAQALPEPIGETAP